MQLSRALPFCSESYMQHKTQPHVSEQRCRSQDAAETAAAARRRTLPPRSATIQQVPRSHDACQLVPSCLVICPRTRPAQRLTAGTGASSAPGPGSHRNLRCRQAPSRQACTGTCQVFQLQGNYSGFPMNWHGSRSAHRCRLAGIVAAHFMGGVSLPLFRAPQSMLRSQGWLLMSLTPDTRQPYRLLRSTCSRAAGEISIRCLTPPPSEAPAHMRPAAVTSATGGTPQRLPGVDRPMRNVSSTSKADAPHLQQLAHEVPHGHGKV